MVFVIEVNVLYESSKKLGKDKMFYFNRIQYNTMLSENIVSDVKCNHYQITSTVV